MRPNVTTIDSAPPADMPQNPAHIDRLTDLSPASGGEPLRVMMTTDCVGGVWTYALQLAEALQGQVKFLLASMGRPLSEDQRADVAALDNVYLVESDYKLEWQANCWRDIDDAGRWLMKWAEKWRPEIVHLNNFCHGHLDWAVPTLMLGHSDVLSWHLACRGCEVDPSWREYEKRVRDGLRGADVVAAPTDAMRRSLVKHYGPLRRTRVLPNARCAKKFQPGAKQDYVFSAARLYDPSKNAATLAEAAAGLEWPVRVAGEAKLPDGSGEVDLQNVASLGQLTQQQVAQHMATASIYCLPARYEPFGLSALEAGLSGCALVLGEIPSLQEVWGDAAEFVPPEDGRALRRTLRRLIRDKDRRLELGRKARERALIYTAAHQAESYLGVYRQLARPDEVWEPAAPDRVADRRHAIDSQLVGRAQAATAS
jgi:glycosyltransferase involved in cell wall biosynthesis